MDIHCNNPNQYLTCRMRKINKHYSYYRFKHFIHSLRAHLSRYRFGHTREQFKNYAERYNIVL